MSRNSLMTYHCYQMDQERWRIILIDILCLNIGKMILAGFFDLTETTASEIRSVSMEIHPRKEKPYDFSISPPSLKFLRCMAPSQ